jgi:hypothetical protein
VGLRKTIGTHNAQDIKPDMLETSLRLAFESTYFFSDATLHCHPTLGEHE